MQVSTHHSSSHLHIIQGGARVTDQKPSMAFHHEHEGFTVTLKGDGKVLWTIDWPFWEGTPLSERPPVVALATLGFSPSLVYLTPGEARDMLIEALEQHGELDNKRRMMLTAIPDEAHDFYEKVPESARLEEWMGRWWKGLSGC